MGGVDLEGMGQECDQNQLCESLKELVKCPEKNHVSYYYCVSVCEVRGQHLRKCLSVCRGFQRSNSGYQANAEPSH